MHADGRIDAEQHVEFEQGRQGEVRGVGERAHDAGAPPQPEAAGGQRAIQQRQRGQQRRRAVRQPAGIYRYLRVYGRH